MSRVRPYLPALLLAIAGLAHGASPETCRGTVYLTLDTGNMRHADEIAAILNKHQVKATFFVAQEKTLRGDHALDPSWAEYWKARVAEGHAFGSHTWRHGSFQQDGADGRVIYRLMDGTRTQLDAAQVCAELKAPDTRFQALTGHPLDPLWRAPGGRTTPLTLKAAQACGYRHVHWAVAGFLGDELPSHTHPNTMLLERALAHIRDGDILMAHLGIWSRKDPFAPMLDPLIAGLKARGFCFARVPTP
ncbi:MAG: polysaccharide deacetylase family protein [Zoogloea sp.]|uniref:polysaccharide deacetylase family protein n=1 Tax=Zoogloea sp. TaxID=49181 RepID=UPI00261A88F8|nr:polysaccharide deacetylase family protein [Zoogloea sp.]MDD2988732.1 polysaccharide deacetylase family protein [Zoogloea sp.]